MTHQQKDRCLWDRREIRLVLMQQSEVNVCLCKAVHTLEKLRNTLLDCGHTRTSTICTHRPHTLEQPSCPLNNIALVAQLIQQHISMLQQRRVFNYAQHLSEKRYRLLPQLLRV